MSQALIFSIIQKLGGKATQRQVEEQIKPNFSEYSAEALSRYVNSKLHKLRSWGLVSKDEKNKLWFIRENPV